MKHLLEKGIVVIDKFQGVRLIFTNIMIIQNLVMVEL